MLKKVALFLLIGVNVFCSESISKVINPQELLSHYKEKSGVVKWGTIRNGKGKVFQATKEVTIKTVEDRVVYMEDSDMEKREATYDLQFNLLKKDVTVLNAEMADVNKFDRIVFEASGNKMVMTKYKSGKQTDKKEKENKNVFDMDPVMFEYLSSKNCKIFNGDSLTPEGKYNMEFKLIETNDLEKTGKDYKFPEDFKKNIDMKKDYKIYVGGMTGIIANFFPFKFYFIIDKATNEMVAMFGNNPKDEAEFEYRIKG